ncbi:MAG: hypothetical protein CVV13_03815 [Gammaproteobacteria bacterium HGW-Gammaproteobacteria-3]|jgi:hypothetical protein|nr:MAG: hypothetical protein CVV13_03815 [Gammaproteobacteria bacterium HGW-Gammaproteobacteria-3]
MNSRLIKLLAKACAILVVVIIAERQYAQYVKDQLFKHWPTNTGQKQNIGELPKIDLTRKPEESYVELINRPLFIEGRRPAPEPESENAATGADGGAEDQVAVPIEDFDWELDGVYLHQDTAMALFSRPKKTTGQASHAKKLINESIDGWKLIAIEPDKVVLEQGGKQHELLLRKPKPTKLPPQVKPAPKQNTPTATPNPFLQKSIK